jgi:short subunit dehydrogenase-like uncharacterized protein
MIYGATGFTGELLVAEALSRGHRPTLAGRSPDKLQKLAFPHSLPTAPVALEDGAALRAALRGHQVVLHAAGPFEKTAAPMREACLAEGVHYLDITGELQVFEETFAQDRQARERGILMVSGVGFDVVASDCLSKYVAARIQDPTELEIAIEAIGSPSGGTVRSGVGILAGGGQVRRGGVLVPGPLGRGGRLQRFSHRERFVAPFPWGDLVTAFHSTGIPNITTYLAMPPSQARVLGLVGPALAVALRSKTVRVGLAELLGRRARGPGAQVLEHGRCHLWAAARNAQGELAQGWLSTPEAYRLTAATGVLAVEKVLLGARPGAHSPAAAFGADFILEVPGTRRQDSP